MKNLIYFAKSWTTKVFDLCNVIILDLLKDFRPSDKFDNPYLTIPRVTNDNREHLCALVSGGPASGCLVLYSTCMNIVHI